MSSQLNEILGIRRGRILHQADEKIMEVVKGVKENGGTGEVTIKLKFKLNARGEMNVKPNVSAKVPQPNEPEALFFVDEDNDRLTREDPKQPEFEETKDPKLS